MGQACRCLRSETQKPGGAKDWRRQRKRHRVKKVGKCEHDSHDTDEETETARSAQGHGANEWQIEN